MTNASGLATEAPVTTVIWFSAKICCARMPMPPAMMGRRALLVQPAGDDAGLMWRWGYMIRAGNLPGCRIDIYQGKLLAVPKVHTESAFS